MWAGEMSGHDAILGMDGMVPAGIRLDLADGTLCLPDEVRIQLTGRRPLYGEHVCSVEPERMTSVDAAQSLEVPLCPEPSETLWLTRGERWVSTVVKGPGKRLYLRITNGSDRTMRPGIVTVGSRRFAEWQNLVFEATTDEKDELEDLMQESSESFFDRPHQPVTHQIAKLPNPEEAEITREEPVGTQADESGDQRPEGAEHASKQDARATKTDEVEKAEEPAADKQVPPIGSGYGRRGHSQVNRERHRLIDRSQTNKFASAKEANPSQKT
ncbi:hypothetical protein PC113_g16485 [Phytophthora cactorum]|uniref:Uncharacterized protein n=1 Tax=Phytophthora cactorum TaxID=29920 RepID=A0A8T0YKS3_9STRA|nr:hypothetical protein PC113_g16485 [Phytophthora cactorum]